jgi:hypothetical protein
MKFDLLLKRIYIFKRYNKSCELISIELRGYARE